MSTTEKARVYSPNQAALGAFLGGPLASIVYLWSNFRALGDARGQRDTLIYGAVVLVALLATVPFLPDRFPNLAIPMATVLSTRFIVERLQVSKAAVQQSQALAFQSN